MVGGGTGGPQSWGAVRISNGNRESGQLGVRNFVQRPGWVSVFGRQPRRTGTRWPATPDNQRKALACYRRRMKGKGFLRVKVQVRKDDAPLVRSIVSALADPRA